MPIGLFIEYKVSPPCGMCSTEKIIGYLDTPASFLEPERVKAGLLWFEKGYVVYQFPNNALYQEKPVRRLEVTAELSSETPGTNPLWRSDITLWVNGVEVGTWISPGDFGDKRGHVHPRVVEAGRLAVRPEQGLERHRHRDLHRRGDGLPGDHQRT